MFLIYQGVAGAEKDYFQQQITYDIKVDLDPGTAKLAGVETVIYKNNSPDTLDEVFFHLFYNAFQPGSYLDLEQRRFGDYSIANLPEKRMGFVRIDLLKIDGLETGNFEIDNTIMKVELPDPLPPGEKADFYFEFISQIPARGSRTAHSGRHFDVGQWYPKPVVYDRYGWHIHQYVDYEFYAEYGDYEIELTLPSEYIVAHMGELLNEEEIYGSKLPEPEGDSILIDVLGSLAPPKNDNRISEEKESGISGLEEEYDYESADSIDYNEEDENGTASDTISSGIEMKTWKLRAENVHDFAFCANPQFKMDLCRLNDITIKAYYKNSNEKYWQRKAVECARKAIGYFSDLYMPYPYKQYSIVSALTGGGMEYPQLTIIWQRSGSGNEYSLRFESIIAHEVAHAWFYGILGFNETEQSCLDEGFATFSEIRYMENFHGRRHNNFVYEHNWQKRLLPNGDARNDAQKRYIRRAILKDEDPMLTPSNLFKDGGRYYNASYEKAASVYFLLQYTLGNDKFDSMLGLLFERWAFKHPYLADLQETAEEIYGESLGWFFRQWFTTTWRLDYSLSFVKSGNAGRSGRDGYNTTFSIVKKGRCVSPLDIAFYYSKDVSDTIHISEKVWMDGQTRYDTTLFLRARPIKAVINPDRRLSDINMLDNSTGIPDMQWQFMVPRFIYERNYVEHYIESYTVAHRPLVWYNSVDGVRLGYNFEGSYLGVTRNIDLKGWVGLNNGKTDYSADYSNPLFAINPDLDYHICLREIEGRRAQEAGIRLIRDDYNVNLYVKRYYVFNPEYIYGDNWSRGKITSLSATLNSDKRFRFSKLSCGTSVETSIWDGDFNYSRIFAKFDYELLDIFGNNTRFGLKAGLSEGVVPIERQFYLSSADPMEIWDSPLYRSRGTLPDKWKDNGRLFMPGGGGLYGYYRLSSFGEKMLTARLERDLPPIKIPVHAPVIESQLARVSWQMYLASGLVWNNPDDFRVENFLTEAGVAFNYDLPLIKSLIKESRIWLYIPLWLSDPEKSAGKFDWRWLIGFTA